MECSKKLCWTNLNEVLRGTSGFELAVAEHYINILCLYSYMKQNVVFIQRFSSWVKHQEIRRTLLINVLYAKVPDSTSETDSPQQFHEHGEIISYFMFHLKTLSVAGIIQINVHAFDFLLLRSPAKLIKASCVCLPSSACYENVTLSQSTMCINRLRASC